MLFFFLILAALPLVLPIITLVSLSTVRRRLTAAEELLEQQRQLLREVERRLQQLGRETTDARAHTAPSPAAVRDAAPAVAARPTAPVPQIAKPPNQPLA